MPPTRPVVGPGENGGVSGGGGAQLVWGRVDADAEEVEAVGVPACHDGGVGFGDAAG